GSDLLPEKRKAFGDKWGVEALYEDYEEMMREEKPDLVAICTKGDVHGEMGVKVAEAGVPMLYLEKAMACSMAEADAVRDACLEHGTVFNTGVLRRFDNRYWAMRELIEEGEIGEVRAVVHFAPSSLMHGHIHSIDTVSYLLGDPPIERVRGELLPRDLGIEDNRLDEDPAALYHIQFSGGVEAWTVPAGHWEFEVMGTEGSVRSRNNGVGYELHKAGPAGGRRRFWEEAPFPKVVPKSAVVACLEDLVHALEAGKPALGNVEVTHHITEACIAVAESHRRGGEWVEPGEVDRELYIFHV
ncbi:MAG: Gfo/Idh/MocA family oxidoreductase, partial [Candidatus Latescibacteria bacterium]|nr:Gfo/Idh/MocA family oxidoreductase [Candidatus Latescibacterota bacterium]